MKRNLLKILLTLVAIYGVILVYISKNAESAYKSYIDSENRLSNSIKFQVSSFKGSLFGAETTITGEIEDPLLQKKWSEIFKLPITMDIPIRYGPIIPITPPAIAIAGSSGRMDISKFVRDDKIDEFKSIFPNGILIKYRTVIGFDGYAKEHYDISNIKVVDNQTDESMEISPSTISRYYNISTLKGVNRVTIPTIDMKSKNGNTIVKLSDTEIDLDIDSIDEKGLLFAKQIISIQKVLLRVDNKDLDFSVKNSISLEKESDNFANLNIQSNAKSLNKNAQIISKGINSFSSNIKISGLGIRGLHRLIDMQKKRIELQKQMAKAVKEGDNLALNSALIAINELDNSIITILNDIIKKDKTKLSIKEVIDTDRRNKIDIDLVYRGEPLVGDPLNALITLATKLDRLFEGSFDMELDKNLIQKLYPAAEVILNSMVSKGMAKLENGLYKLKFELKDGKVIINNTKYAPKELIMLILM